MALRWRDGGLLSPRLLAVPVLPRVCVRRFLKMTPRGMTGLFYAFAVFWKALTAQIVRLLSAWMMDTASFPALLSCWMLCRRSFTFIGLVLPRRSDMPDPMRFQKWIEAGSVGRSPGPHERVVITTDGSFMPSTGQAGWSLAVSLHNVQDHATPGVFVGCLFGLLEPLRSAIGEGFGANDPYLAEVAGLFWCAALALRMPYVGAYCCRADNFAALQGAEGTAHTRDHPLATARVALHLSARLLRRGCLSYAHVRGHQGDVASDLSDGLAVLGARESGGTTPFRISLDALFQGEGVAFRWLPHICLTRAQPEVMPPLCQDVVSWSSVEPASRLPPSEPMRPILRAMPACSKASSAKPFAFRCVSFNALSLLEVERDARSLGAGLYGAAGHVVLLSDTLVQHQVFIAGIQEARTPAGTCRHQAFVRYCSGCDSRKGHGVEMWVANCAPWPSRHAAVLHVDPTRMVLRLAFLGQIVYLFTGHAPRRGHSTDTRAAWWSETSNICRQTGASGYWILMLGGNCRIGEVVSEHIGAWHADPEDDAGIAFHALLVQLHLWVPSTFEETMSGPGGTLLQKGPRTAA